MAHIHHLYPDTLLYFFDWIIGCAEEQRQSRQEGLDMSS